MGIIRAAINSIKGGLADSWQEVIQPGQMSGTIAMVPGVKVTHGKSQNTKGTPNTVSNGSVIQVYDNQCMLLIDGGKVADFTAEPGYYQVSNSSMPSLFCGQFGDSLKETFSRIKYGGIPSQSQYVIYINLAEIPGITFGTRNIVNYFDSFYNAELFLRAHGTYSIKITDPLKFYQEVVDKGLVTACEPFDYKTKALQYSGEFETALSSAINNYSADGLRISFIKGKSREFGQYMAQTLDEEWEQQRGFQVQSVFINISYNDESTDLINMRNKGAMLSDAAVQQGYVAANVAEGMKAAGSNSNGAMAGFMGMGVGMNAGSGILGGYQQNPHYNNQQPQQMPQQMNNNGAQPQQPQSQQPQPAQTAQAQPAGGWTCACGAVNSGKFCSECGSKKPEAPKKRFCTNCGTELNENAKFCPECGTKA
ncbi:MAG: SPFH domain-containing protein [Ruminococcus sp.]